MVAANRTLRLPYRDAGRMVLPGRMMRVIDSRPPLTGEDLGIHALLNERLALLHRERHGLWAKARRFLFALRPV